MAAKLGRRIRRKLSPRRAARRLARRAVGRTTRRAKSWWRGRRIKVKPERRRRIRKTAPRTATKEAAKATAARGGRSTGRTAAPRTLRPKPATTQRAVDRAAQRSQRTGRDAKAARAVARGTVPMSAMSAYSTSGPAAMQLGTVSGRPNRRGIPSARRARNRGDCPWCRGLARAPFLSPDLRCQPCNGTGRAHPGMMRPTGRYRAVAFEAWQPDVELAHSHWFTEDPVAAQQAAARLIAALVSRRRPASVLRWRIEHRP